MLPVFDTGQELSLRSAVPRQRIGNEYARHRLTAFQQRAEEFLGRPFVASALDQDVEHRAVLLTCPPQGGRFPLMLRKTSSRCHLSPAADRFVASAEPTRCHQFLDIAKTQRKPVGEPKRVADDFGRVALALVGQSSSRVHVPVSHTFHLRQTITSLCDNTFTEQLLGDKAELRVLGDKAYLNAELQADLQQLHGITLLTPRRSNQREQLPAAVTSLVSHFRQMIETINSQLAGQFKLETNKAKCMSGLIARLHAKLAAHTLGMYLNVITGQPLRALAALAVI